MRRWFATWRPLLRMAWRDVRRAKARSALVLLMITLPVLAVTTALVVGATQQLDGDEGLERRLGAADARITVERWTARFMQGADPDGSSASEGPRSGSGFEPLSLAGVGELLDREVRGIGWHTLEQRVETDAGAVTSEVQLLDLADPLADGLFRLQDGRVPESGDEVVVNRALADRGPGLGETLQLPGGRSFEVVGVGEDSRLRDFPVVVAPPGAVTVPESASTTWLVDASGPVAWSDVRALNERGAAVLSRAVLEDPPSSSELPAEVQSMGGDDGTVDAVLALVVVMVLLEVVLLAGPAFAVTARRQSRNLALMAALGGTPAQARRAVVSVALVLGGLAAAVGTGGGILLARFVAVPVAQHYQDGWFGPFDVPWVPVLVVAGFGLLAALLAAAVPAWLASRADVVAVLAGRRGDPKPSALSPVAGLVLLGLGVAGAVLGATLPENGEGLITVSALVSVAGMLFLVPSVLAGLARASGRLPLPLRYAVRDAARHRTRTVPAVAAVAATVVGVVALGISTSSDAREDRETYQPSLPMGHGAVVAADATEPQWRAMHAALERELPEATITQLSGSLEGMDEFVEVSFRVPGEEPEGLLEWTGGWLGSMTQVGEVVPPGIDQLTDGAREAAEQALADGRVVVLTAREVDADQVRIAGDTYSAEEDEVVRVFGPARVPATYVVVEGGGAPIQAVVPPGVAEEIGMVTGTVSLQVSGAEVSDEAEETIQQAVAGATEWGEFYVERGHVPEDVDRLLVWVLGALGGVLMLGGTLTATFLALSDARPDLATLAAVGAAPRTRRAVAASYAVVVGGVGAVLGALVGFVPGIAVAFPLTRTTGIWQSDGAGWSSVSDAGSVTGPFIDVPWLLIGSVVVLLPLFTAAVVGLATRSRLPMVARLD